MQIANLLPDIESRLAHRVMDGMGVVFRLLGYRLYTTPHQTLVCWQAYALLLRRLLSSENEVGQVDKSASRPESCPA